MGGIFKMNKTISKRKEATINQGGDTSGGNVTSKRAKLMRLDYERWTRNE
jgi:hypothetical protein